MILIRFIPEERLPHFWSLLESSKSCIMGGVVACAMMGANYTVFHADIAPMQLDVVVALNQGPLSAYEHWT